MVGLTNQLRSMTFLLGLFLAGSTCFPQERRGPSPVPIQSSKPGIQDNSFLIEEAYNQEQGVVQHISSFSLSLSSERSWLYQFTQEWPAVGQSHQISCTIPYESIGDGAARGIGDVLINYRYQFAAAADWAWVAPRLSVILPTGDHNRGLGDGSFGLQIAVPISKEMSDFLIYHVNFGGKFIFSSGTPTSYYAGGSAVWRPVADLNFLLESLIVSNAAAESNGAAGRETEFVISPGSRFALNFSRLQVVPGIGIPISFRNGETSSSLFLYLSFEHPF